MGVSPIVWYELLLLACRLFRVGKDTPSVSLKEQYTQSDIPQHVRVHVRFQMIQNARAENTLSQKGW